MCRTCARSPTTFDDGVTYATRYNTCSAELLLDTLPSAQPMSASRQEATDLDNVTQGAVGGSVCVLHLLPLPAQPQRQRLPDTERPSGNSVPVNNPL